jgi:hypothetical protein
VKAWVGRLPPTTTPDTLKELLDDVLPECNGNFKFSLPRDASGTCKGFAFLTFGMLSPFKFERARGVH